jgi:hypothetical protein
MMVTPMELLQDTERNRGRLRSIIVDGDKPELRSISRKKRSMVVSKSLRLFLRSGIDGFDENPPRIHGLVHGRLHGYFHGSEKDPVSLPLLRKILVYSSPLPEPVDSLLETILSLMLPPFLFHGLRRRFMDNPWIFVYSLFPLRGEFMVSRQSPVIHETIN